MISQSELDSRIEKEKQRRKSQSKLLKFLDLNGPSRKQKLIEAVVTNSRGYNKNNYGIPKNMEYLRKYPIGLYIALADMDYQSGKMNEDNALEFSVKVNYLLEKIQKGEIKISSIKTPEQFQEALENI